MVDGHTEPQGEQYVGLRCPNRPEADYDKPCGHLLGGPLLSQVEKHDFSTGPLKDSRICPHCKTLFLVEMYGPGKGIAFNTLPKGATINFSRQEEIFTIASCMGRKVS